MLELKELAFSYRNGDYIFQNVDISISSRNTYGLMGQSGSGKSTLLNIISGLQKLKQGKIFLDAKDVTNERPASRDVGYVFQDYGLFPNLSVEQNIEFGFASKKLPKKEVGLKTNALLEITHLTPFRNQNVNNLSGGQKQRVALARTLASAPRILLLDEVFSAIDNEVKNQVRTSTKEIIASYGMTTLLVSHSFDDISHLCSEVFFIEGKKIVGPYKPADLILNPVSRSIAKLIGMKNIIRNEFGNNSLTKDFLFVPDAAIVNHNNEFTHEIIKTGDFVIVNGIKFTEYKIKNQKLYIPRVSSEKSIFIDWTKVVEING